MKWPYLYKMKQNFDQPMIKDLQQEGMKQIHHILEGASLPKGAKIGIPAGSRGIANISTLLKVVVNQLQQLGYQPFLFSAMGSHGGGTEEGQQAILNTLGITEKRIGCPVIASSAVVQIGKVNFNGIDLPVYTAKDAAEADGIIVINRVKPHTSFSGPYESGLIKMMAVGMGRAKGAERVHQLGAEYLAASIPLMAKQVLQQLPILGGLAIIENANEQIAILRGIKESELFKVEKELLLLSKSYLPKLPVKKLDFTVIQEMGKNFSGTGMDTNVIGRLRIEGIAEPLEPRIQYIAVLDLSEESHGNAIGIGLADFTTEKLVNKIDMKATYLNCLTSGFVTRAAIPLMFANDKELFAAAQQALKLTDLSSLRMVVLKNTLHIDELWVSEQVYHELEGNPSIEKLSGPIEILFNKENQLILND